MLRSAWVPLTSPLTYRLSLSYRGAFSLKHIIWWEARGHVRLASPLNPTLISSVFVCFTVSFLSRRSRQRERHHAVTWRNQCHDRATLQGVRIPSTILKIVFRHILFFFVSDERLQYTCYSSNYYVVVALVL